MSRALPITTSGAGDGDAVLASIRRRIEKLDLDLADLVVVTELATGAYAVTAVIAAMAGARRVHAIGRDTEHHGRFEDALAATLDLARRAGVEDRIDPARHLTGEMLRNCDVLTNSGHLRPLTRDIVSQLPSEAVIGLMYEDWEFRAGDLDLAACLEHGIRLAAVNECHPQVGVFAFLGPLCAMLVRNAGIDPPRKKIALVCDNPFSPFLRAGLEQAGAIVTVVERISSIPAEAWDAIVLAVNPSRTSPANASDFARLAVVASGARLLQFWGDVDRSAAARFGFRVSPPVEPRPGHMGILLSDLGYEPIIRLQAGGLRAAEYIRRGGRPAPYDIAVSFPSHAAPGPAAAEGTH